jgi:predicted DCC family thiol-disulfide oxidoreductase YuxK
MDSNVSGATLADRLEIDAVPQPQSNELVRGVESPAQDVVLFDGQCNFCRQQVSHLRRLDGRNRLRYVSLHDPWVAEAFPDLSYEQLMEQMWVIAPDGARYGGASALKYLSRRLPILWPMAPALHFPGTMPFWNWMYRQVAKRRYRIAGRQCEDGSCSLHGK